MRCTDVLVGMVVSVTIKVCAVVIVTGYVVLALMMIYGVSVINPVVR